MWLGRDLGSYGGQKGLLWGWGTRDYGNTTATLSDPLPNPTPRRYSSRTLPDHNQTKNSFFSKFLGQKKITFGYSL